MSFAAEVENSGRPKLSLQPRSSAADLAPPATTKSSKPSPFGAARPREQVIAEREGKNETEVLKEQAQREWKGNIILTEAQREEKKAAEAALAFARKELEVEVDPVKLKHLKEELTLNERKLQELLGSFEKLAVQAAQVGGIRRAHEKKRGDERGGNGYTDAQDGFISFSRGRGRENASPYGDAWGGCFNCGEVGHYSRDCPNANAGIGRGNYGSRGGRPCYTCGQEGHYSRECPLLSGAYGAGGGYEYQSYDTRAYGGARGAY